MPKENVLLTRTELYQRVWSTPMQKLAQEFGVSDVGLAKLCRRHKVPVPGRGYWARLAAGQKIASTPLPSIIDKRLENIEIRPSEAAPAPKQNGREIPVIPVSDDRSITHPLAVDVQHSITRTQDEKGILVPRKGCVVNIRTSPTTLPRAMRVLDALLFAADKAGYQVSWPKPRDKAMQIHVLDEPLAFSITEIVRAKLHELRHGEDRWTAPRWDYEPTGALKLAIDCQVENRLRRTWTDGKRRRIEHCLGHFIAMLPVVASTLKKEREERAERQRRWAEEARREEEARRRKQGYDRKARVIEKLAQDWKVRDPTSVRRRHKRKRREPGHADGAEIPTLFDGRVRKPACRLLGSPHRPQMDAGTIPTATVLNPTRGRRHVRWIAGTCVGQDGNQE